MNAEAAQVQACLHDAGFTGDVVNYHGYGVLVPRPVAGFGFPVAITGVRTRSGFFYVGIAPGPVDALRYLYGAVNVPGGSLFEGSYDGSVTLHSEPWNGTRTDYEADRAKVIGCAFSLPAAPGEPKTAPVRADDWNALIHRVERERASGS